MIKNDIYAIYFQGRKALEWAISTLESEVKELPVCQNLP